MSLYFPAAITSPCAVKDQSVGELGRQIQSAPGERGREAGRPGEGGREAGRPGERGREGGREGGREREGGRVGGREREGGRERGGREREGGRERDISSLSLPTDVDATRIPLIPAADVDTTRAPTGLNLETCQWLG